MLSPKSNRHMCAVDWKNTENRQGPFYCLPKLQATLMWSKTSVNNGSAEAIIKAIVSNEHNLNGGNILKV